jgi:hypothetical protein
LASLVDPELDIIRTKALPTWPLRLIGDIGVRALPWHLAALRRLRNQKKFDFLLITVPSFFSAVLGQLLWRDNPLPFGIDYIDPWVHVWPEAQIKYSKAWASMKLGATLVTAAMPYGFSTNDFTAPAVSTKIPTLFDPADGRFHLVYAGALLPKAITVLERLLEGIAVLTAYNPELSARLRLHFIGTGKTANDRDGYNVRPIASRFGVADQISEHPHRMGYLDVLAHLTKAHGVLIIGSTEAHYTPSKVYQSVQARRPVLALLHEQSTAIEVLRRSRAGFFITLTETRLPQPLEIANALEQLMIRPYDPNTVNWRAFAAFSSRESARTLAAAMDEALDRWLAKRSELHVRRGMLPGWRSSSRHPT